MIGHTCRNPQEVIKMTALVFVMKTNQMHYLSTSTCFRHVLPIICGGGGVIHCICTATGTCLQVFKLTGCWADLASIQST
jgi:hypothetical protein